VSDLGSAPVPELGADDHVRGPDDAPVVIEYGDYECPYCAAMSFRLEQVACRLVFRHFPVRSSHPRAWAAACAAEAAGRQGHFWAMHHLLFADAGRLEDPHLWQRADQLGLDVARFDADRRSAVVQERVRHDFRSGVRAGVVTTPTLFAGGARHSGVVELAALGVEDRQA
jgi:protein-disulfide isomerase